MIFFPELPEAACREISDPDVFFPSFSGRRPEDAFLGNTQEARQVCAFCVERPACLQWALTHDEAYGIWGGTDPHQRARMRRQTLRFLENTA